MNFHHFPHSRIMRWIFRFRKRCGYGIHSPFAFNLVTGVIYESGEYYAYSDLTKLAAKHSSRLRLKDNRLLFRLVNHHDPVNGFVFSSDLGLTEYYLRYAKHSCNWHFFNTLSISVFSDLLSSVGQLDFVYLDANLITPDLQRLILNASTDRTLVVINGVHQNALTFEQWNRWIADPKVRVSFDLYDFGLLYFEQRLNKEDYIINYY